MKIIETTRQTGPGGEKLVRAEKSQQGSPASIALPNFEDLKPLSPILYESNLSGIDTKRISTQLSYWNKFRKAFIQGPKWFQLLRSNTTMTLNFFGIALNSLAVIGKAFLPEKAYNFIDEKSEWFSKYIIPISFSWNSVEALVGHRLPEAISRIVPALSFWALPFYNFNLATGVSSALNYIFEHVKERHGGRNPGNGSMVENAKQVFSTSIDVIKDIVIGKRDKEDIFKQLGTLGLFFGSFGGMIFTRKQRDSLWARVFGNMRNIGGLIADYKLIFNDAKDPTQAKYQREVGAFASIASILNIFMRWVNPELARMFNHISIAADDYALTRWAQVSKEDNDRELSKTILHGT